jgi:hypothetical protein
MSIIGLDISTSCTGICVLDDDGTFRSLHHVDLSDEKDFYKKVDRVLAAMHGADILYHHPTAIFVEAPLLVFKMKASMASTIALLQRFNACVCYSIYKSYPITPRHISVVSARKIVGLSLPKKKKKAEIKPMVFEFVKSLKVIPESHWQYKKTGNPKDWVYDECDAYVVARAGYEVLKDEKKGHKKET